MLNETKTTCRIIFTVLYYLYKVLKYVGQYHKLYINSYVYGFKICRQTPHLRELLTLKGRKGNGIRKGCSGAFNCIYKYYIYFFKIYEANREKNAKINKNGYLGVYFIILYTLIGA